GVDSEQETPPAPYLFLAVYKIVKKYKMVKTQHNSVNGITFHTQSQSVNRDIVSCQSAGNG
ncbi:MAG: hypothetical protein ACRD9Q_04655, partial [Nitrososphaeraceae archaeon]